MPSFVSSTVSFFNTALTWIAACTIPVVALVIGWHAFMRSSAGDEMAAQQHTRAIKNALTYGAVVLVSSGLASAILSFFRNNS